MAKNYFFPLKKSKILRKISRSGRSRSHLGLRNILSVRTPHIKKQVAFKWIFRWFYAFWDYFFCGKWLFQKATHPPHSQSAGKKIEKHGQKSFLSKNKHFGKKLFFPILSVRLSPIWKKQVAFKWISSKVETGQSRND